jgi:hypothetical protein
MSEGGVDWRLLQQSLKSNLEELARLKADAGKGVLEGSSGTAGEQKRGNDDRLPKLEGMIDVLKLFPSFLLAALALTFTVMVALLGYVATQVASVERRVDSINGRLSEEFRVMRADMNAQTSAISNAVTATRQAQPQILVIPAPETTPKSQ